MYELPRRKASSPTGSPSAALRRIKLLHTLIWLIMAPASFYILYAGLTRTFTAWLWIAIAMLVMESGVLVLNGWECPLTSVAKRYTTDRRENFDIYLPRVIARYNKAIFGTILAAGLVLVLRNLVLSGL